MTVQTPIFNIKNIKITSISSSDRLYLPHPLKLPTMRTITLISGIALLFTAANLPVMNHNILTSEQHAQGWKLLFDGKTTAGWHNFNKSDVSPLWKVEDGSLLMSARGAGDLVTNDEFEDFELELEWKLSEGGNSGIFYGVKEEPKYETPWLTGLEMQILDDDKHPDAKQGKDGNRKAGSLYDLIAAKGKKPNPIGQWNQVKIVKKKGKVQHFLNGSKIVEFDMDSPAFAELVKNSKFVKMPDFAKFRKGHLALQDHGDPVWFRNIRIKTL